MPRLSFAAALIPLALLAACDRKPGAVSPPTAAEAAAGNSVASLSIADGKTKIDVPGLSASLSLPRIALGGSHMDLDGMKLYPGSEIVTMDVRDTKEHERGGGLVTLDFTSTAPPAALADYYRNAAAEAGFTVDPAGGTGHVAGTKPAGDRFAIDLAPQGDGRSGGSRGRIVIAGTPTE